MKEVIELVTLDGDVLHGTRLTSQEILRIRNRAAELVPMPDPKAYEQPMDNALFEGDVLPAEQNEDYKRAVALVSRKRSNAMQELTIAACWRPLGADGKQMTRAAVLALFIDEIEHKRAAGITLAEDDYVAALYLGWLRHVNDLTQAAVLPMQAVPLAESEVREGVRFFRVCVQRTTAPRADREAQPSGADTEPESAPEDGEPVQRSGDGTLLALAGDDRRVDGTAARGSDHEGRVPHR